MTSNILQKTNGIGSKSNILDGFKAEITFWHEKKKKKSQKNRAGAYTLLPLICKLSECLHFSPRGVRITLFQVNFLVPDFQAIADTEDFTIIVICVKHYK